MKYEKEYIKRLQEYISSDRIARNNQTESDFDNFCEQHCSDIELLLKENEILERNLKIKDEYLSLIWAIGFDYDGAYTAEGLRDVIDELVKYSRKAVICEDESTIYINGNGKALNILQEEIKTKEK